MPIIVYERELKVLKLFDKIINLFYPPKCIFCQQLLNHDAVLHICGNCYGKLPFMEQDIIPTSQEGEDGCCDGAISVFHYTGMVKESLIRFKFYNKPSYYRTYARLIADRLSKITGTGQYDIVMSVPLHRHKEFSRGYNQAYLISKALSKELGLPEASRLLRRYRYTENQSLLDKHRRHQNVKGAFNVLSPKKVNGKSVLLVDDILTTGSTLEECSRMLKLAGAKKVTAAVVATGRKF
jgi:competence protein ComFC